MNNNNNLLNLDIPEDFIISVPEDDPSEPESPATKKGYWKELKRDQDMCDKLLKEPLAKIDKSIRKKLKKENVEITDETLASAKSDFINNVCDKLKRRSSTYYYIFENYQDSWVKTSPAIRKLDFKSTASRRFYYRIQLAKEYGVHFKDQQLFIIYPEMIQPKITINCCIHHGKCSRCRKLTLDEKIAMVTLYHEDK